MLAMEHTDAREVLACMGVVLLQHLDKPETEYAAIASISGVIASMTGKNCALVSTIGLAL
mgnify:CR=1 FL=1